ncbi:MAG: methyl-accepting chemotaxis protein, partial [Lachnospiraceae bacterium]|nr:methyl-accepting chemotaxis protein [Lachnospiraceae bacterium]
MNKKSRNMVRGIILIASALALAMAATVGVIGFNHIKSAYANSFAEGLKAAAILLESELSNEVDGDWSLSEDGQILKGDSYVHDSYQAQLDTLHAKTGMDYT